MADRYNCDCEIIHQDVVNKVKGLMPEGNEFYDLADLFKMFADSTRVKILWALSVNEMCVCDLAALINMTKSAVSHQLKSLRLATLVRSRKDGKTVFYSLADGHVRDIFEKGFEHLLE
jgi:ArsR family transcriptional regulator